MPSHAENESGMRVSVRNLVFCCVVCLVVFLPAVAVAQETVHEVQPGETLYALSRRYGVDAEAIQRYNGITDPRGLRVGQTLRIPRTYEVQSGDNAYRIGLRFNVDWRELLDANGLTESSVLQPGDILLVPPSADLPISSNEPIEQAENQAMDETVVVEVPEPEVVEPAPARSDSDQGSGGARRPASFEWPHEGEQEQRDGKFPGISFSAQNGDPIYSVASGTVFQVVPHSSFGTVVMVRATDGYVYVYGGNADVSVGPGDRVTVGTLIGHVGFSSAFQSTRAFLSVYRNYRYIDPNLAPRG